MSGGVVGAGATAAVVLGAGRGERLGGDGGAKPARRLAGRPLVAWALDAALGSGLEPVLLVVGWRGEEVADLAPEGVRVVRAERFAEGIVHSLHAALAVLEPETGIDAVCVGLADQPLVGPGAYARLAEARSAGASLAVATYGGRRGNPVLIARSLWPEVRALRGDVGARALMGTHEVTEVDCTTTGDPRDVDTAADLRALEKEIGRA